MITKQDARNKMLQKRDLIPLPDRKRKSSSICEQFSRQLDDLAIRATDRAFRIAAYEPMRSEVDVHPLLDRCYEKGWHIFLPCMAKDSADNAAHMVFFDMPQSRLYSDRPAFLDHPARPYLLQDLVSDGWEVADDSAFDAVVVPMVAFDDSNMRLGYGGGNYDRFLPRLSPDCFIAGVAFEEQRIEQVPTEPHDLALPIIFRA